MRIFAFCMRTLYLFNPENDMALAYGGSYYMPPANVQRMARELSPLSMWYASEGADVWLADIRQIEWMSDCPLALRANGVMHPSSVYTEVCPWGWNASLVRRLKEKGVADACCPSVERMERIRNLSARMTAMELLKEMDISGTIGDAEKVDMLSQCLYRGETFLLKAPWSGSGRGIQKIETGITPSLQGWINHILKTQGYLIKEPFYDKVIDFAMEFRADGTEVHFVGYSLFETDARGIYKENLLASDEVIVGILVRYVSENVLRQVRMHLQERLSSLFRSVYQGYLGVDMMVCRTAVGYAVHPCVEINLRMNMGVVSRLLYDRYVSPSSRGRFVIEYCPCSGETLQRHEMLQAKHPLVLEDKKIRQGYLSLTPVFSDTAYQAYIYVE